MKENCEKNEAVQPLLSQSYKGNPLNAPTYGTSSANRRHEMLRAAQVRDSAKLKWLINLSLSEFSANRLDEVFALHLASWVGDLNDLIEPLLKAKANPFVTDMNGDSAIHYCVRAGNVKLLKYYHKKYGDEVFSITNNKNLNLLLMVAAETPDDKPYVILEMLEWLYLKGCSLESQDCTGKTALMHAAQRGSLILIQYFLSRCANLGHRDHMGRTALHLVATCGDEEASLILCQKGAICFLHCKSNDDPRVNTPLRICWNRGHHSLGVSLRMWNLNKTLIGTCTLFSNSYAWYFLIVSFINFLLFLLISNKLLMWNADGFVRLCLLWSALWMTTNICWFVAFFSNPGFVKRNVVPSQTNRCSKDFRRDLAAKWMSIEGTRSPAMEKLFEIERDQFKISYELYCLNQQYSIHIYKDKIPLDVQQKYSKLSQQLQKHRDQTQRLMGLIGKSRQDAVPTAYRDAVIGDGSTKKLCLSCRMAKPFRTHHCSDCAHCVRRFDHHCIWLDNCVGIGNQRAFYLFLLSLSITIIFNWILVGLFFLGIGQAASEQNFNQVLSLLSEPLSYILSFNALFNVLWFGFVSYLLYRTSKAMITNITFYEYLKRPMHIVRRFNGKTRGFLWDLADLTPAKIIRNICGFWTLRSDWDILDYPEAGDYRPIETEYTKLGGEARETKGGIIIREERKEHRGEKRQQIRKPLISKPEKY